MKKRCRVYRPKAQEGGTPETGYTVTQDSQTDPIPEEKANNFLTWLHKTNQTKRLEQEVEASMMAPPMGFMQEGGNVSMDQLRKLFAPQQKDPSKSGYETGDYGQKKDTNFGMFAQDVASKPTALASMNKFGQAAASMYENMMPKNQQQTSQQPVDGEAYTQQSPTAPPAEEPFSFGAKPGGFGAGMQQGFQLQNGGMIYAQDGTSYPGAYGLWDPTDDDTSGQAFEKFMQEQSTAQPNIEDTYTTDPGSQMREFEPGGPDDPFNEGKKDRSDRGKFGSIGMDARNTNQAQAAIAGTQAVTGFIESFQRRKDEKALKNRFSDVFETHAVAGSDRGDYMVNVPGVGDPLKPDQHTRMGYNTKIAQDGVAIQDNTRVAPPHIPAGTIEEQIAEADFRKKQLEELNSPYTTIAIPDGNSTFPNDSVRFFPGQRGSKVPYIRDLGNLAGVTGRYSSDDYLNMVNNQGARMYQDTSRVQANPDFMFRQQNGGEYAMDDELEMTENQINELIAQGYQLEYLD